MPPKIYIDGQAGTTALRIRDWLAGRNDLKVVRLNPMPAQVAEQRDAVDRELADARPRPLTASVRFTSL
jgi:N-acetyl-gamma-glutamylphosphate reductase